MSPYVSSYYFQLGFGCLVATFWEIAAHSVDHMFFFIMTICNFSYFPFLFLGLDLGSDCFSSWLLHTFIIRKKVKSAV